VKPPVIRPANIRAVLLNLIEINPLYSDIVINKGVLQRESVTLVQLGIHAPSTTEGAQGPLGARSSVQKNNCGRDLAFSMVQMYDISAG